MLDSLADRLKWARNHHGQYKSPTEAARAFGWPVSTYLGHENGDRNPSRQRAIRYGQAYGVRWEWILEGTGSPTSKLPKLRILGKVERNGEVVFYPTPRIVERDDMPLGVNATEMAALEVVGGAMRGIADDGWLIFFEDVRQPPTKQLVGKLCVLEVADGRVMVRTLQPGRKKGRYDLESSTEPTLRDQQVVWAARVTWIKPR